MDVTVGFLLFVLLGAGLLATFALSAPVAADLVTPRRWFTRGIGPLLGVSGVLLVVYSLQDDHYDTASSRWEHAIAVSGEGFTVAVTAVAVGAAAGAWFAGTRTADRRRSTAMPLALVSFLACLVLWFVMSTGH